MQVKNGQPLKYKEGRVYVEVCCDCGLTHAVYYFIKRKTTIKVVYRDDYETARNRRRKKC